MSNKKLLKWFFYFYPSQLPRSQEAWQLLFDKATTWFNLPKDDASTHAISTLIMHMPQQQHRAPLKIFVRAIKKQMANEAAYLTLEALRAKAKEKMVQDTQG